MGTGLPTPPYAREGGPFGAVSTPNFSLLPRAQYSAVSVRGSDGGDGHPNDLPPGRDYALQRPPLRRCRLARNTKSPVVEEYGGVSISLERVDRLEAGVVVESPAASRGMPAANSTERIGLGQSWAAHVSKGAKTAAWSLRAPGGSGRGFPGKRLETCARASSSRTYTSGRGFMHRKYRYNTRTSVKYPKCGREDAPDTIPSFAREAAKQGHSGSDRKCSAMMNR